MAELTNTFSWSHSRAKMFRECLRRYYWNYYGSWNGWRQVAPEEARLAYRLKHLATLPMWAGGVVHRVIENALRAIRAGQNPALEALREEARLWLNEGWAQSLRKEWQRDPKRKVNLFEHYYGAGAAISKERRGELREHVFGCVGRFFESQARALLLREGPQRWLALEDLQSFDLIGVPVWVKLDAAVREGDGAAIIDWKTGARSDDDPAQIHTYALYAMTRWRFHCGQIAARVIYLREGAEERIVPEAAAVIDHRETIMASIEKMRSLLADPAANEASLDSFPMCDDRAKCARCNFKQLCLGKEEGICQRQEKG